MEYFELINKKIGERIKQIRYDFDLTQSQMAKILDVTDVTISNFELGKTIVNARHIITLHHKFNIDFYWLFFGIGNMIYDKNVK